jgi:hypothetical protein
VVFANRVPDGKERLRNEIQLPEPRYSAYKPARDSNVGAGNTPTNFADGGWGKSATSAGEARSTPASVYHKTDHMDVDSQDPSSLSEHLSPRQCLPTTPNRNHENDADNAGQESDADAFTFQRDHSRIVGDVGEVKNESLLSRRLKGLEFRGQQAVSFDDEERGEDVDG